MSKATRVSTGNIVERKTAGGVTYHARFRVGGKRVYVRVGSTAEGKTRKDAERLLAYELERVRRGEWSPPAEQAPVQAVPTFHEAASDWFAARKVEGGRGGRGLSPRSVEDIEWRLDHVLPAFGPTPLDRIGVAEVDAFRRRLVREGKLGARSINRLLDVLSAVIEEALDQEVIVGRNPARGRRRRLPVERPRRAYLDRAEHIQALLDAAGDLDREHPGVYRRAAIATLVFAGLRIGELADLRWSDVHLASGRLHVRSAKTAAGERTVEILPVLRDELAALAADRRGDDLAAFVFGTSKGGRLQRSNFTRRVLRLAVERANGCLADRDAEPLPEGITPHSLRRTYASLLYAVGEAAPYVMAQMGHTDPSLALAIYAQAMDRRDGEPERLAALVGRVTTGDKALGSVGRGTESERMSA